MRDILRKVEIFVDNMWKEVKFEELKVGDKFRMFEPTGERVLGSCEDEWVVTKGPYGDGDNDGVLTVQVKDYNEVN